MRVAPRLIQTHPDKIANAIRLVSTVDLWQAVALRRNEDVKATKAQLGAIVDRRNKIAHEADLDPGNPGERWPIDRPLVEEAIDFIESTIRAIYEVLAQPGREVLHAGPPCYVGADLGDEPQGGLGGWRWT